MSLQKLPSSLPPEPSPIDKSYSLKRREYASQQWREQPKAELTLTTIATCATALIIGSLVGGILAGVGAAGLTFLLTLLGFYIYHYLSFPRALDKEQRQHITTLTSEWPKRVKEIEKISQYVGVWEFLEGSCQSSPYRSLPDELKKYAAELEKKVDLYLDDEARKYLADTAGALNDAARIDCIIKTLNKAVHRQGQLPELNALPKGKLNP